MQQMLRSSNRCLRLARTYLHRGSAMQPGGRGCHALCTAVPAGPLLLPGQASRLHKRPGSGKGVIRAPWPAGMGRPGRPAVQVASRWPASVAPPSPPTPLAAQQRRCGCHSPWREGARAAAAQNRARAPSASDGRSRGAASQQRALPAIPPTAKGLAALARAHGRPARPRRSLVLCFAPRAPPSARSPAPGV